MITLIFLQVLAADIALSFLLLEHCLPLLRLHVLPLGKEELKENRLHRRGQRLAGVFDVEFGEEVFDFLSALFL